LQARVLFDQTLQMTMLLYIACVGVSLANPVLFVCNDPRLDGRNKIMGLTVKSGPAAALRTDVPSYSAGSSVVISFSELGWDPYFVTLHALPQYGYLGQYGNFSGESGGYKGLLRHQEETCPNQVYSSDYMESGSITWTAHKHTYGPVQITLMWGNTRDLYRTSITLNGPAIPDDPPALVSTVFPFGGEERSRETSMQQSVDPKLGVLGSCVDASGSYNLPNAPVFIQKLQRRRITFPAGQCIPCRDDFLGHCGSVTVHCPQEAGKFAIQKLFTSDDCTGDVLESRLPTDVVLCPGPDHYSPDTLDLSRFVKKLQRDHPTYFPDAHIAEAAIQEYKRMLHIIQKFPDSPAVPSKLVDLVWHEHILDTQTYRHDSQRLFGKYIHHEPSFGDDADESVKQEKLEMVAQQHEMLKRYSELFGERPSSELWPQSKAQMGAGRLPDCCSFQCVKVDCVTCVGCNAVYCGKLQGGPDGEKQALRHVLPEDFVGYVPYLGEEPQLELSRTYLCSQTPMTGMTVSWTISGKYIHFQQSLSTSVAETWHAIGFTDVSPYDMGYADFIVSFFTGNFSAKGPGGGGVRDLYKYDAGNHYPCFDVLTQCSLGGHAGTMDLLDRLVERKNGKSISSWTRLLDTGDTKDKVIKNEMQKVMFAIGVDDDFTYHPIDKRVTHTMNFFSSGFVSGSNSDSAKHVV